MERAIRANYTTVKRLREFYKFNCYLIFKIVNRYERILSKSGDALAIKSAKSLVSPTNPHPLWSSRPSFEIFESKMKGQEQHIEKLHARCVNLFSTIMLQPSTYLATGELEYVKARDEGTKTDRFVFGVKLGVVLALVSSEYMSEYG